MAKISSFKIIERPNVIDDHLLDIIGREFKFDHEKGLAEWFKNSVDAYLRVERPDSEQYIIFRFTDGKKDDAILECIDFVGMAETDIEKAFIRWGDPEAAKRGLNRRVYGGHGNGGKFYMRQMFDVSYFVTYRDGYLNIFGFNKNRKYGFADGYKNKKMKPDEALKFAGIDNILSGDIRKQILSGKIGFTAVRGIGPQGMKNKIKAGRIAERLKSHPQARRLLIHKHVSIIHNNQFLFELLQPDEIKPLPGFEEPRVFEIPKTLTDERDGEKTIIELSNKKYEAGKLILRTSEEALQTGRFRDLNRVDFISEVNETDKTVIATYELLELGVRMFPQAAFIYGECACSILEDSDNDCVRNDRSKLVENDLTRVLLGWIRERVDELASAIVEKESLEQKEATKKISSVYNEFLDRWKNRWMRKIFSDMFAKGVGNEEGKGTGGKIFFGELQAPLTGFEFRFTEANIPINESSVLTLKASVPIPIPIGGIVNVKSDNPLVDIEDNRITVKSDYVKMTENGEEVAIMDIHVTGRRIGESATISAKIGKYNTEMKVNVIEAELGGVSRKPKYPRVLLSGQDADPLGLDKTVFLSPRHNLVYQRFEDVKEGIYWINTQSPLAVSILDKFGVHSPRWREYLFQRYIEIFMKEALYELQKKDPEAFRADRIDNDIMGELVRKIHSAAAEDLGQFLFNDDYDLGVSEKSKEEN